LHDRAATERLRIAAIRMLPPADSARVIGTDEPESLQVAAVRAVMESGDEATIRAVFERAPALPRAVRRQAISSSIRSRVAALELERAISDEKLALTDIDPVTRQALEKFSDAEVKARANKLFAGAISPDRDVVVQKYRGALKMTADQKRGAGVFERNCAVCHQMQGVGAKIGPDLSGIGQQPRETLLVQILDPSRQVLPDFVAYNAETKSGESYVGFIAKESPETVTLRRANESDLTLKRSEIKTLTSQGKSLMPDGLEAAMTEQDVADLIEFLRRPDRTLFTQHK
jgi:putative heme-binding domain-containing protein